MDLETKLKTMRKDLTAKAAEYKLLTNQRVELETELAQLKEQVELHAQASAVLSAIGEEQQSHLQTQIESLVTEGLQRIFEENYSFHLVQSIKANAPQVEFIVRTTFEDGSVLDTDPMTARGGGLTSVVGMLLRVVLKLLDPRQKSFPLCLDEVASMISEQYLSSFCRFVKELVSRSDLQVVWVTHQDVIAEIADVVYRLDLDKNGHTVVRREK